MKKSSYFIIWIGFYMIFLAGCTEKKKDNSDEIAKLQKTISELSKNGDN